MGHVDTLAGPVNLQVVMGEPGVSNNDSLLPKVCDDKVHTLCMLAILEYNLDFLCDGSILIWSSIDVMNWDWVWQGVGFQLVLLDKGGVDEHSCCTRAKCNRMYKVCGKPT